MKNSIVSKEYIFDNKVLHHLLKYNDMIKNKITLDEKELADFLGTGFSKSTLFNLRKKGDHFIEYLQISEGSRVLYPIVFICDILGEKIDNKEKWIVEQINQVAFINKKSLLINENQFAKLLNVSASTIAIYRENHLLCKKYRGKSYLKEEIAKWILKSSVKVT